MGRLISLDAVSLVWWRMLLAALALLLLPATWRGLAKLNSQRVLICAGIGVLLAISWILFYLSIKLTNASVAVICLGASPLFISLFGPWITRTAYQKGNVILSGLILLGLILVAGGIPEDMYLGLAVGLLSAASLAAFSGLNKRYASQLPALSATSIEMAAGAFFIAVLIALFPHLGASFALPDAHNFYLLLILALVMTAIPMALLLVALRRISVFAQQTAVNLEPLYAIILAVPILGEAQELSLVFYLGALIIVATVLLEPLHNSRTRTKQAKRPYSAI